MWCFLISRPFARISLSHHISSCLPRSWCADSERQSGRRRPGRWTETSHIDELDNFAEFIYIVNHCHIVYKIILQNWLCRFRGRGVEAAPEMSWRSWALGFWRATDIVHWTFKQKKHQNACHMHQKRIQGKSNSEAVDSGHCIHALMHWSFRCFHVLSCAFFLSTLLSSYWIIFTIFT